MSRLGTGLRDRGTKFRIVTTHAVDASEFRVVTTPAVDTSEFQIVTTPAVLILYSVQVSSEE